MNCINSHCLYLKLNDQKTSHFYWCIPGHDRNLYNPILKRFFQIAWSFFEIFSFIHFGIAWTGRINLKKNLGYDIKFFSIWAFMGYPFFPTKRSQKWHLSSFATDIAIYFMTILLAKEDKCHFWDLFGEKKRTTH